MHRLRQNVHGTVEFLRRRWRNYNGDTLPVVEAALPAVELTSAMQQASVPSFAYFFMLGLASAIATFGLLSNSAPAIIGAMIIAPLMAPIMSLTFGIVVFDRQMILRSILSVASGVVLVVACAYASTLLFGLRIAGSEVLNRVSPTLIDLTVAMAAGGAAAFAYTRRSIMNSIAGVAIAVALVPPLAVVGIGLALGRETSAEVGLSLTELGLYSGGSDISRGAFLLFVTNLVGIVAVGIAVFAAQRYGYWKTAAVGLALGMLGSAFLIRPLGESFHKLYVKSTALQLITKVQTNRPEIFSREAKIESISITYRDDQLHVDIKGFAPAVATEAYQRRAHLFQQYLSAELEEPVYLHVQIIPVEMLRFKAGPSTAEGDMAETQDNHEEAGIRRTP